MNLRRYENGSVAKFSNKRCSVVTLSDGVLICFKKLKEEGGSLSESSFLNEDKKTVEFGFRISREAATALISTLFSELYRDGAEDEEFINLFR